jgi:hypothetical protein
MSAASSASRAITPTNQPSQVGECPGAPARPERPAGLTVDTSAGRALIFEASPRANTPKKPRRESKVYPKEDLASIATELNFGSV